MSERGYDYFVSEPDLHEEMHCKVCGSLCDVERGMTGATSFVEAMGKRGHRHDLFICPYSKQPWHDQALRLVKEIQKSPSPRLIELMRLDLEDILKAYGLKP